MPPEKRRAIWAIYVWCRRTDEIMDGPAAELKSKQILVDELDAWEKQTRDLFDGVIHDDLGIVMADTIERFSQPLQPYLDMIEGMRMDLEKTRYQSFQDLKTYCYCVAGTVGVMSQNVMGVDPSYTSSPWSSDLDTTDSAVALGIANQLTNILRDVGEDRSRGRIYLPQEDLSRFGYSEDDLLAGTINENFVALMKFQIEHARDWFRRSEIGVQYLCADARWPVWTSLRLYRGILSSIESNGYDVFNKRAFVPRYRKLVDLPFSFLLAQFR